MRRARIEMMLARHVGQWVVVASAVGHHHKDRVIAIRGISLDGGDDLFQTVVHDRNRAGVMGDIAPVHIVTILEVDHEQFGPQFLEGANSQFG